MPSFLNNPLIVTTMRFSRNTAVQNGIETDSKNDVRIFFRKTYNTGIYTTNVIDIGAIKDVYVFIQYEGKDFSDFNGAIRFYISTSDDNSTWSSIAQHNPVNLYSMRYFKITVSFVTNSAENNPFISKLKIWVNLPDMERSGSTPITFTPGTQNIDLYYGYTFNVAPEVIVNAIGPNLTATVTSKSLDMCSVTVVNSSGSNVNGSLDWRAKGY